LLLFTTAQKGWSWLLTHAIVEGAKALGGSFKFVTLAPKTKGDDSTAQGNIKEWGHMPGQTRPTNFHIFDSKLSSNSNLSIYI